MSLPLKSVTKLRFITKEKKGPVRTDPKKRKDFMASSDAGSVAKAAGKVPIYKNKWFWIAVALVAIGLAVGLYFALRKEDKAATTTNDDATAAPVSLSIIGGAAVSLDTAAREFWTYW